MKVKLTEKDRDIIKYQCRMGYILPFFFLVLGSFFINGLVDTLVSFGQSNIGEKSGGDIHFYITEVAIVISSFLLFYLMNRKYFRDLRNNEKVLIRKTIQTKESVMDVEAGSAVVGSLPHNRKMNKFIRYYFIIDNTRYRVDQELFEKCREGEDVYFHVAPISNFRIKIDVAKAKRES